MITQNLTQEMIDVAIETGEPLRLLEGVYRASPGLQIKQSCGLEIVGAGMYDPENTGPGWSQLKRAIGTKIVATSAALLLDLTSSMGPQFSDLVLDGAGIAPVGLGCYTVPGWPSSAVQLHNVLIQNFTEAGVQFGTPSQPDGWNSDLSIMDNVTFDGCPIGIQVCNCQSVGHAWSRISHGQRNGVCISLDQGGNITLRNVNQNGNPPRTFLRLGAGGCNVGTVLISGGHVESGTLIDASAGPQYSDWNVRIESVLGTVPGVGDWPIIKASQWPKIKAESCSFNGRVIQAGNFSEN